MDYEEESVNKQKYRRPFDKAIGEYWDQNEIDDNWREKLWGPKRL